MVFSIQNVTSQEGDTSKIKILEIQKEQIILQEKEALKNEVKTINKQLENKEINEDEAKVLKEDIAKKRALNIENRIAIIDNKIALLERNDDGVLVLNKKDSLTPVSIEIGIGAKSRDNDYVFGMLIQDKRPKKIKYDHRTTSKLIVAFGLNNTLIDNQSLDNSPYKIGASKFFEIGWAWRTRVFKNSNFLRLNYGLSFQFNGLKPTGNQYFVSNNGQTELQEFEHDLKKAKFRMDNLVFPIHFEIGPSKVRKTDNSIRYSNTKKFRFGFGGYAGFNLNTRQKLKYEIEGENVKDKLKRNYNTNNFVYGLSAYTGFGDTMLYLKYDLNPIFKNALIEQRNISLGLRFHL